MGELRLGSACSRCLLGEKAWRRGSLALLLGLLVALLLLAPAMPALAAEPGPGGITSDEFDGGVVDGTVWRFVDPLRDSGLSVASGRAAIAIPGGASHDLWSGSFNAPRLLQNVPDGDFEVELKLDGELSSRFQLEGIVVQQDVDDLLRAEVHHNGSGTYLFVAVFVGGNPQVKQYGLVQVSSPLYLRLARAGDWWTLRYSSDGANWLEGASFAHAMTVRSLGPFAGNVGGPAPAFSLPIDYVRDVTPPGDEPPPPPPDSAAPVLAGVSVSVGVSSAVVSWATDEPADSRVEYGATAGYGQSESAAGLVTAHELSLAGLVCETSYHFRVSSADAAGNRATAADATFTTAACPSGPGWVRGDEFEGGLLDQSVWRVLDPLGDSSVSVGSGRLRLSLPAGSGHDLWPGSMGAPRLLQAAGDGDFEIEARFDSAVSVGYQSQGLVAQAGFEELVRFDVYSPGGAPRVFAATFAGGSATIHAHEEIPAGVPVFLRMRREGSTWTLRYSLNGSSWMTAASFAFPLVLREFGLFAGNPITAPAFTAEVDHFRVLSEAVPPPPSGDSTPPAISGLVATAAATGATVEWATDEPADSRVEYGPTAAYGQTAGADELVSGHSVSLSGLSCASTYHYRVSSADAAGNRASGDDRTFTTTACPPPSDTTPPVLSGVAVSASATGATVSWATDEPADSRVEYGATTAYGETRVASDSVSSHSLNLSGLVCETLYHFRVSSADASSNRATSDDATFSTTACPSGPPGTLRSDEFDGASLDAGLWRVLDPLGDSSVSVSSGLLRVSLPAGRAHDLWEGALHAPRVLQPAVDADFEVEAKFDSAVTATYQSQGLVAQADFDDLVRFDVYSAGGETRLFAATFAGGSATVRLHETIPGGAPVYLRVRRAGSVWTLRYSLTGSGWTTATSFSFPLMLRELGLFAGNPGPAPAFVSQVDYFRVLSEGPPPPPPTGDTTPPVISGVAATTTAATATVTWTTDEPADSQVAYGLTASYGQARSAAALVSSHGIDLSSLACATTYHFRVSSADAAGNRTTGGDRTLTTGACVSAGGPGIDVWYGDSQRFGDPGAAQRWFNVLGHASDPDGLLRLDYRVDGGPRIELVYDPRVNLRIGAYGDFNIELDRLALAPGRHLVTITACDASGNESTRAVELDVVSGRTWPLPYETDWSAGLQSRAQIVDGLWTVDGDGVRSIAPGYDRTIAIGDESWTSVDASVPVTVHAFSTSSDHAGVGIAAGWRGHEGSARPRGEWPLGALCFYYRHLPDEPYWLYLIQYGSPMFVDMDPRMNWLEVGTQYVFRIRAEPVDGQQSRYSCKVWRAADPEPLEWHVSEVLPRRSGSLLLVSDHADVTFGRVTARSAAG